MKHVGNLKTTGVKVIVVNRTLPGDPLSCLVIDRQALKPFESEIVESLLESGDGQNAFEFGHVLGRHRMPLDDANDPAVQEIAQSVTGISALEHLHNGGRLLKQSTDNVLMIDGDADALQLDALNEMIAEQKGVKIDGLSIQADTTASGDSGKQQSKLYLSRAERLQKQVDAYKERAYELDPDARPKKGRPKKNTEEA
jgi:hypothetical protein|tara:strand:+ start:1742 stop:2335 length:594 start_codon:yes stop_codon:yes gene_type:complete